MISTVTYNGDGVTRIFPVAFEIKGEEYTVVYVGGVAVADRSLYDIINNSIVFNVAPVIGTNNVEIVVASTTTEIADLNTPPSTIQTVLDTMADINAIAAQVVPNIDEILLADDNAVIATNKAIEASASAVASANSANSALSIYGSTTVMNNAVITATNKAIEASASASTATTKSNEASASANNASISASTATAKANLVTSVVIPTSATYNYTTQDWRGSMMSKAQFNALASERRANRAGSGFDELDTTLTSVNSGISTSLVANTFIHGNARFSINGTINRYLSQSVIMPTAPTIYPYNLVMPYGTTLTQAQIDNGWTVSVDSSNSGMITNGKFTTNIDGWNANNATSVVGAGYLEINPAIPSGSFNQLLTTEVGKTYSLSVDAFRSSGSGAYRVRVIDNASTQVRADSGYLTNTVSATITLSFTAIGTTTVIELMSAYLTLSRFDNVYMYPIGATLTAEQIASGVIKHADSSNRGLIVNGKFDTDTSGWSGTNGATISLVSNAMRVTNTTATFGRATQTSNSFIVGKQYIFEIKVVAVSHSQRINVTCGGTVITFTNAGQTGYFTGVITPASTATDIRFASDDATIGHYFDIDNIAVFPADAISRTDFCFLKKKITNLATNDFFYPFGNTQFLGTTGDCGATVAGAFAGSATYSLFSDIWQEDGALVGKGYVWSALSDANKKLATSNPESNTYLDGNLVYQAQYGSKVEMMKGDSFTEATAFASLGYTQDAVDKGLWKHADGSEAIGIALVHRRNQGVYHPVYNPNGTKLASDGNKWYNTAISFTSIADCFTDTKLMTASGYIGTTSARPDGLFYDQIHEGDITDLRNSSAKIEDYNRLIDREFNKLVAGTYRGSEGEIGTTVVRSFTKTGNFGVNAGRFYFGITGSSYSELAILPLQVAEVTVVGSNGSVYNIKQLLSMTTSTLYVPYSTTQVYFPQDGINNASTMDTLFPNGTVITVLIAQKSTRTKSNTLTHTDIIGSPANYPTAWKQSGVSGVPLIVAEDGTSLLPTGALTVFKLSRKANATPLQVLKSTDSGATWTALTVTTHYTFSTTTNTITFITAPATTDLIMVTYQTHTNMVIAGVNSEVLANGNALLCNGYYTTHGSLLLNSLISKVAIGSADTFVFRIPLASIYTTSTIYGAGAYAPTHNSVSLDNITSPSVKTFPYLTHSNGKARLRLVFKEMKHNGTSWGDDSKFNIVDHVSTTTDNNAQTVLIGLKYAELPYFISAGE